MAMQLSSATATVAAALIAAFIGLLSLVISKEQKVSEFRQAWINALRDDLAEAISSASTLSSILQNPDMLLEVRHREWARFAAALARIELRLNRTEPTHKNLISCIVSAQNLVRRLDFDINDYDQNEWENLGTDVVKISQDLLKIEWNTVKNGEPFYKFVKYSLVCVILIVIIVSVFRITRPREIAISKQPQSIHSKLDVTQTK